MLTRMAVVWAFRIAIAITPTLVRVCQTSHCQDATWVRIFENFHDRLNDSSEDPDELSTDMTTEAEFVEEGGAVAVTDVTGTFELRKLQWRLSRAPSGGSVEDQDVMTFHFLKESGGSPAAWVDSTDLPALEALFDTYWGTIKSYCPPFMHSDQYRWYKDGPAFWEAPTTGYNYVPITPNPAIRVTEVDVAGTSSATHINPPQVAFTVTEKTSTRTAWGRWYLPLGTTLLLDDVGRMGTSDVDGIVSASVTLYNGARAAHYRPVVWSIAKLERPKKPSGTLAEHPATAYEVLALQCDNLWDVIRRRRYDAPTYRKVTTLT